MQFDSLIAALQLFPLLIKLYGQNSSGRTEMRGFFATTRLIVFFQFCEDLAYAGYVWDYCNCRHIF